MCRCYSDLVFTSVRRRDAVLAARLVPARRGSAPPGPMKSFTNEGADRHAGAPGPALPPDAAHEGGAGNDGAAATHEGGAADDPAGAAPPAEAAGVAPPETPATAAPLLAAPEIQAAATAEEESQPRTRRPRPDDGQRVGTWRTARRGNQMYSSSCTLLDLRAGTEERQYVTEVILRFGEGRLPNVPDNTSLRVLLSTVLNCSPMRITRCVNQTSALNRLIGGFALRHHEEILGPQRAPARALPPHRRAGARGPRAAPDTRTRVPPARPGRRREADDEPLRHVRPAHAAVPRRRHHHGAGACVEINQCDGCTRQLFTKSFLGDGVAALAPSSGEEPTWPRHRAGVASMA